MEEKKTQLTKKQSAVQIVKFGLFSVSAGVIQMVTFTLMNELLHLQYWPSYLTALILSVLFNFTVNRKFTFKSAANIPIAMLKVAGFYLVFTPLSTWAGNTCAEKGVNEYIVLICTMVLNLVLEYLFCRFFVYRNNMNTNESARAKEGKN